jgi:hypothetical protein
MTKNFRTAITLVVAICGLVVQLACHAQKRNSNPRQHYNVAECE